MEREVRTGSGEEESDVVFIHESKTRNRNTWIRPIRESIDSLILLPFVHTIPLRQFLSSVGWRKGRDVRDVASIVSGEEMRFELVVDDSIRYCLVVVERNLLIPPRSTYIIVNI